MYGRPSGLDCVKERLSPGLLRPESICANGGRDDPECSGVQMRVSCGVCCLLSGLLAELSSSAFNPFISFNNCRENMTLPLACSASACCKS